MTQRPPIRVVVVDDSRTVRAVLKRLLAGHDELALVGEASSGEEAVAMVHRLEPDVVLMDVEMPDGDGLEATARIMSQRPTPILLFTSHADRHQLRTAFSALQRGAVEVLPKPSDTHGWESLRTTLPQLLVHVAGRRRTAAKPPEAPPERPSSRRIPALVAVGASTGGPAALREFLTALPADGPVGVAVVQHIAPGFEVGLAEWLNTTLPWQVQLASDAETLRPGQVRLAPCGSHLEIGQGCTVRINPNAPARSGHKPSVDVLFESCALNEPGRTVGVLLSGMGTDGAAGLMALRRVGGLTLVQDEPSCAVFGMPRAALAAGAAALALPPAGIGEAVARLWRRDST